MTRVPLEHNFGTVEEERRFLEKNSGGDALIHYLKNFNMRIPGFYREDPDIPQKEMDAWLDEKPEVKDGQDPIFIPSDLRISQTQREFLNIVADELQAAGIYEKALELNRRGERQALCNLVLPVYFRLRERGYKRYPDLIA